MTEKITVEVMELIDQILDLSMEEIEALFMIVGSLLSEKDSDRLLELLKHYTKSPLDDKNHMFYTFAQVLNLLE